MNIQELISYHEKAAENLTGYANDEGMKLADRQHYIKRAMFHIDAIKCLKVHKDLEELNSWDQGGIQGGL